MQLTWRDWTVFALAMLASVLVTLVAFWLVPPYRDMFAEFGGRIPAPTSLLYRYYWLSVLLPVSVFAAWRFVPGRPRKWVYTLLIGLVGSALLVTWIVQAIVPQDLMLELIEQGGGQ